MAFAITVLMSLFMSETAADSLIGQYDGTGSWYDSAGKTMSYRVVQRNRKTKDGVELQFKHDFADGTITEAAIVMSAITPVLFKTELAGSQVGHGYCLDRSCHYHIKRGDTFVEVSYRPSSEGLEVYGSSTRNGEGLYIAWHETLRRAPGAGAGAQEDAVKQIQRLEEDLNTAFNRYDAAAMDRLFDEELSFISPNGTIANKAQRLAGLKTPPANIPQSTNESVSVKLYGEVAVAVVFSKWTGINEGKPFTSYFRATHVWARRAGTWKLVAAHVSQTKV